MDNTVRFHMSSTLILFINNKSNQLKIKPINKKVEVLIVFTQSFDIDIHF